MKRDNMGVGINDPGENLGWMTAEQNTRTLMSVSKDTVEVKPMTQELVGDKSFIGVVTGEIDDKWIVQTSGPTSDLYRCAFRRK